MSGLTQHVCVQPALSDCYLSVSQIPLGRPEQLTMIIQLPGRGQQELDAQQDGTFGDAVLAAHSPPSPGGALGMQVSDPPLTCPVKMPSQPHQGSPHTRSSITHPHRKMLQRVCQDCARINSLFTQGWGSLQGRREDQIRCSRWNVR